MTDSRFRQAVFALWLINLVGNVAVMWWLDPVDDSAGDLLGIIVMSALLALVDIFPLAVVLMVLGTVIMAAAEVVLAVRAWLDGDPLLPPKVPLWDDGPPLRRRWRVFGVID